MLNNQELRKKEQQTIRKGVVIRTEGLGQITRKNGVTITELETRVTDILERMIVLEGVIKEYRRNQQKC